MSHSHTDTSNFKLAFFLNLGFALLEVTGGLLTNSLAILSNALHDLADTFSLGLAWGLDAYSRRGSDQRFSYGYWRFSLLGALLNAIVLVGSAFIIIVEAIPRLRHPVRPSAQGMLVFALIGVIVNTIAFYRLRRGATLNAQVITWHFLQDVLGWVAVLVVSIILLFVDVPILDPILSLLITVYVLYNVVGMLRQTMALFLQAVPQSLNVAEIEKRLRTMDYVQSTHHTHVWSLDGEHHVLSTHVVVDVDISRDEVLCLKRQIRELTRAMKVSHTTIEIEFGDEGCGEQEGSLSSS
jgi:cobalt-zinc-cadmium efflux system protein